MAVAATSANPMLGKLQEVLALFSPERPELTGPEIARAISRPRSTVYRLLGNFTASGFLDHEAETGRYRLGIMLASFGHLAQQSTSLQRAALPALRELSETTSELASLMVRSGQEGITIDVIESYHPVMIPGLLGGRQPLHATAGGKALLAWLPEDEQARVLSLPLKRYTASTIVTVAALKEDFATARKRGYTMVEGERFDDVVGVAAPVRSHRADVVATLAVGCPRSRAHSTQVARMGRAVVTAAASVSRALGYGGR